MNTNQPYALTNGEMWNCQLVNRCYEFTKPAGGQIKIRNVVVTDVSIHIPVAIDRTGRVNTGRVNTGRVSTQDECQHETSFTLPVAGFSGGPILTLTPGTCRQPQIIAHPAS
ncbi:hypothetical protein BaRGS_00027065 [Batillaria attramentaria]|uniref:Uncharacterized protein n=1 Tax=Batillaria attramentaria TaxID=370345 RepID=A0ABD0K3L5_9CAEN